MASDTYTKIVLTAIALCLFWLCLMRSGLPVEARQSTSVVEEKIQPVVIVGWGTFDANGKVKVTMSADRTRSTSDPNVPVKVIGLPPGPVDVSLEYSETRPLPVGLTSVRPVGEWAPIRSAVEPEPVRPKPGRE